MELVRFAVDQSPNGGDEHRHVCQQHCDMLKAAGVGIDGAGDVFGKTPGTKNGHPHRAPVGPNPPDCSAAFPWNAFGLERFAVDGLAALGAALAFDAAEPVAAGGAVEIGVGFGHLLPSIPRSNLDCCSPQRDSAGCARKQKI